MSGLNGAGSVLAYSSRDSTRIVKYSFDAANIRTNSVTSKFSERNLSFFIENHYLCRHEDRTTVQALCVDREYAA